MGNINGWLGLLLGFSGLVFIHELGHFLLAKWNGVHVHVFSIGMGPYLISFTHKGTVYALSLIPLGGYVKMMGQDDLNADLSENKNPADFRNKRPGQKAAILVAGAVFNIITTVVIFSYCYWSGTEFPTTRLGFIAPETALAKATIYGRPEDKPAKPAHLKTGDRIISVNGVRVKSQLDLMLNVTAQSGGDALALEVQRKDNPNTVEYVQVNVEHDKRQGIPNIGLGPGSVYNEEEALPLGFETEYYIYLAKDPSSEPETKDMPAGKFGKFKKGDRILALLDKEDPALAKRFPMNSQYALIEATALSNGDPRWFEIERDGMKLATPLGPVTPVITPKDAGYKFGFNHNPLKVVTKIDKNSDAYKAGLREHHLVMGFDADQRSKHPWKSGTLKWVENPEGKVNEAHLIVPRENPDGLVFNQHYVKKELVKAAGAGDAIGTAWEDTTRYTVCMFATLRNLVTGNVNVKNLSGPVGIGQSIFGVASENSFNEYLWWLGFISLNLGVMQLLPIPLLDGFHLVMVLAEKIKGSAVSAKVQEKFMYAGIAIIGSLLVLVMWTDISRLFGR